MHWPVLKECRPPCIAAAWVARVPPRRPETSGGTAAPLPGCRAATARPPAAGSVPSACSVGRNLHGLRGGGGTNDTAADRAGLPADHPRSSPAKPRGFLRQERHFGPAQVPAIPCETESPWHWNIEADRPSRPPRGPAEFRLPRRRPSAPDRRRSTRRSSGSRWLCRRLVCRPPRGGRA